MADIPLEHFLNLFCKRQTNKRNESNHCGLSQQNSENGANEEKLVIQLGLKTLYFSLKNWTIV